MRRVLILLLLLVPMAAHADDEKSGVVLDKKSPEIVQRSFDPLRRPPEMPPLHGSEAAVTVSEFTMETAAGGKIISNKDTRVGSYTEVEITSVTFHPKLKITIWLPNRTTRRLTDHENGHRKIAEIYWDRFDAVAKELGQATIGKHFDSHANSSDEASRDAIKKAINSIDTPLMKRVEAASSQAQDRFDQITNHGRNDVAVPDAIKRAIDETDRQQ